MADSVVILSVALLVKLCFKKTKNNKKNIVVGLKNGYNIKNTLELTIIWCKRWNYWIRIATETSWGWIAVHLKRCWIKLSENDIKDTTRRDTIPASERLAIGKWVASAQEYLLSLFIVCTESLKYLYQISSQALGKIIPHTCCSNWSNEGWILGKEFIEYNT